jgi:hypothetical protein
MKKGRLSRRKFLSITASGGLIGAACTAQGTKAAPPSMPSHLEWQGNAALIDRSALVKRHNPLLRALDPLSPLSLGNGEFAFTADVTGLQTFPQRYEKAMPLCTLSQWGWHTSPSPGFDQKALRLTEYDTHGRDVGYATSSEGQADLYNWLRENPHRLHLGQIGLRLMTAGGREAEASDVRDIEQQLDLWAGTLISRFKVAGEAVTVRTAVHPELDLLAVAIESALIAEGKLAVRFAFPYGSSNMQAADWGKLERHQSKIIHQKANRVDLGRLLDRDEYFVAINWKFEATFTEEKPHTFLLTPARHDSRLEFLAAFAPQALSEALPGVAASFTASERHWQRFWTQGGAVELMESRDRRAQELERRVVLSQYLTAIQCAGTKPPQETGLTVNSWYGKFHLEMHWWHAAHFALWNRLPLLEKSLNWYNRILPVARKLAEEQGYRGARWPKMVGPEGRDSPSPIGPLLIWQQPHPIFYAELCYGARRDRAALQRYRQLVFESAEFMVSFAHRDAKTGRFMLGPPVIPAQENHPPRQTWNPTFELAYWAWGLQTAQRWRQRCGLKRNAQWDEVLNNLAPLPVGQGVYLAHENCPQTFSERNTDHPSMLAAFGLLSGQGVHRETMRRTLKRVMREWQWDKTWGWDYPMVAMTAARLGEPQTAIDALLMETEKNRYLPNGHNWQRENLPCYLPGNGGLLYAVAMMAAGWQGAPRREAPGFPDDGSWKIRSQGLNAALLAEL